MSTCEKCWADARAASFFRGVDQSAEYNRLLREREESPCSAEEMAGPCARECPSCGRLTLHQHTGEPMCSCDPEEFGAEVERG